MTTTQLVIVCATVLIVVAIVTGRRLTVTFRDVKATVEKTNEAVGEKNGQGTLAQMNEKTLAELAEIRAEQEEVKRKLEERTHVLRTGRTEPEELAVYTQDRMHDILSMLAVVKLMLDTMWSAMKDDYNLPPLPSMNVPQMGEARE